MERFAAHDILYDSNDMDWMARLAERIGVATYSSAFSGIDAPGTAFAQLRAVVSHQMNSILQHPEHKHAIDVWFVVSCAVLKFVIVHCSPNVVKRNTSNVLFLCGFVNL